MLKYLISPTKTMQKKVDDTIQEPYFKEASRPLLMSLCDLTQAQLKAHFKLSEKLASTLYQQLHPFEELTPAWHAYQGQQFKALQANTIDPVHHAFVDKHVGILSGLYGLLNPFDSIGLYRLPLDEGLPRWDVVSYWRPKIKNHLQGMTIINLSSKEYRQLIQDHESIYDIDFVIVKEGVEKRPSMTLKTMRGLFLRYVINHEITTLEALKSFQAQGFVFEAQHKKTLTFIKKET